MAAIPAWAKSAQETLETVAGTVSSKVEEERPRFGFFNSSCCESVFIKDDHYTYLSPQTEWHHQHQTLLDDGYTQYPSQRCRKHRSMMKRWQQAKRIFVRLDELRMNEELEHLRFVTKTRPEWNLLVPMDKLDKLSTIQEQHKKKCVRQYRNWRNRNKWWQSRNALGQYWPECKHNAEWDGVNFIGIRLHFHVHAIIVSKYLDNRPQYMWHNDQDGQTQTQDDSRFFKEWGGIVDVRSVKDYQVKYQVKGETKRGCGRKACMRYLTKYITKADGWRSIKIGHW